VCGRTKSDSTTVATVLQQVSFGFRDDFTKTMADPTAFVQFFSTADFLGYQAYQIDPATISDSLTNEIQRDVFLKAAEIQGVYIIKVAPDFYTDGSCTNDDLYSRGYANVWFCSTDGKHIVCLIARNMDLSTYHAAVQI